MKLLLYLLIVILFASCSAQRHLQIALKKDPSIIQLLDTTIIVRDTIQVMDMIEIAGDTVRFETPIDSLFSPLQTVYEDSLIQVRLAFDSLRRVKGRVIVKERKVPYYKQVLVEKRVTVPGKVIAVEKEVKGFWYWSGIIFWILAALLLLFRANRFYQGIKSG